MNLKFLKCLILLLSIMGNYANAQNEHSHNNGDLFNGITKKLTYDKMILPYGLEVTFDKTVHIIFPSSIKYVDLGNTNIIAGKASGVENVLRIKAAVKDFIHETNLSVITDDGNFYSFNVKYVDEPRLLSIEMKDFIHNGDVVNKPSNALDVYLKDLGNQSPKMVNLIMKTIYKKDRNHIRHIKSKKLGIEFKIKGIYAYNNLLYFHLEIDNTTNIGYDIDFVNFKIVDRKIAKRTAIQEYIISPLRSYNFIQTIPSHSSESMIFVMKKFSMSNDKHLLVRLSEQNGGRNQIITIKNNDLINASSLRRLKLK